jgi:hypothetical protein
MKEKVKFEKFIIYTLHQISMAIESRRMRWAGHITRMGAMRFPILPGKAEGKRPVRRPRRRCEENIKTDIGEILYKCVVLNKLPKFQWWAFVNTIMNIQIS